MGITHLIKMSLLHADVLATIRINFGVQWKSDNKCSRVSVDHALEWLNAISKRSGGLSSITQIDSATLRYYFP